MMINEKIKGIKDYCYLGIEARELQEELKELRNSEIYANRKNTNAGRGDRKKEDKIGQYTVKLMELEEVIEDKIKKICERRLEIECYINDIEDIQIRLMLRLRYMRGYTWKEIGEELEMTKQAVYQKYSRYIKSVDKKARPYNIV